MLLFVVCKASSTPKAFVAIFEIKVERPFLVRHQVWLHFWSMFVEGTKQCLLVVACFVTTLSIYSSFRIFTLVKFQNRPVSFENDYEKKPYC